MEVASGVVKKGHSLCCEDLNKGPETVRIDKGERKGVII